MTMRNTPVVHCKIDLQKAFDTVNHNIHLKKLEIYGIKGMTNKRFKSG